MSIDDVINHIQIEEYNKTRDKVEKANELSPKVNLVEEKPMSNNKNGPRTRILSLIEQTRFKMHYTKLFVKGKMFHCLK